MSKRSEGHEAAAFSSLEHHITHPNPFSRSSLGMVGEASAGSSSSRPLRQRVNSQAPMKISSLSSKVQSDPALLDNSTEQLQVSSDRGTHSEHLQITAAESGTDVFFPPLGKHQLLHDCKPKHIGHTGGRPNPLSLVTGIFFCWSKSKENSGACQHPLPRAVMPLDKMSTSALVERTRLQHEALVETQDTRDMWEWQMEQQQAMTSQEHNLIERNSIENPLSVLPGSMQRSSSANRSSLLGELTRNTSISSCAQSIKEDMAEGGDEQKPLVLHDAAQGVHAPAGGGGANPSIAGSESPSWDAFSHNTWNDPEVVSAMLLLFESALLRCRSEVAYFCRVYMQQMVLSGYALIRTLVEMEPNTVFARKVHASYALEGHVHAVMFRCFETDSFDDSGVTRILDPAVRALARAEEYVRMKGMDAEEALRAGSAAYDQGFHAYCAAKSEEVMGMFTWMSMGYRSAAERDRFMEAFLRAAKWVWLLHRLANSTNPPMHILRVGRGHVIDPVYVESVCVPPIGSCPACPASSLPKVEFMIMPGFVSPTRRVFPCKVYQHYMCKAASQQ